MPEAQVWPGPQAEHTLPEWPHAVAVVPAGCTHVVPLQQPVQLVALQTAPPVQTPAVHVAPLTQPVQVAPLTPHDVLVWALGC